MVQDDLAQSAAATAVVEGLTEDEPGFVSVVALVELHWVLRRAYRSSADEVAGVIRTLLDAMEIVVQHSDAVRRALARRVPGTDFADALIAALGTAAGCTRTVSFDRNAAKLAGVEWIPLRRSAGR